MLSFVLWHCSVVGTSEFWVVIFTRSFSFSPSNFTWSLCVSSQSLSCVQLFATPWAVAYQAPLSMGFSRQESWSGCHFLLQGIFPTQGLSPDCWHLKADALPLSHLGSPPYLYKVIKFFFVSLIEKFIACVNVLWVSCFAPSSSDISLYFRALRAGGESKWRCI